MFQSVKKSLKDSLDSFAFAMSERRPIVLANGQRTIDYQVWRVAFGRPEKGIERFVIDTNPIVYQELLDDPFGTVVYKKLQEVCPGRLFPSSHYYLEYRLPGAPFAMRVNLGEPGEARRLYRELDKLPPKQLARLAEDPKLDGLKLVPRAVGAPVFDLEPEDLVRVPGGVLNTGAAQTAFLADLYLAGRISAQQFDEVMHQPCSEMRESVLTVIPAREQPKHEYLLQRAKVKKEVLPEDKYHLGQITLEEYAGLKRPDLAAARAAQARAWPLAERTSVCVVCGADRATVRCLECDNRACVACVRREFSEHRNPSAGFTDLSQSVGQKGFTLAEAETAVADPQPFPLMHHVYCLRNGRPSRDFMHGLHHYEIRKKSVKKPKKRLKKLATTAKLMAALQAPT